MHKPMCDNCGFINLFGPAKECPSCAQEKKNNISPENSKKMGSFLFAMKQENAVYSNGIIKKSGEIILFDEVEALSFHQTDHYTNDFYDYTDISLSLHLTKNSYVFSTIENRNRDNTLVAIANLRDIVANIVANRMAKEFATTGYTKWCEGFFFTPLGLRCADEYGEEMISYDDIHIDSSNYRHSFQITPRFHGSAKAINFLPGSMLLQKIKLGEVIGNPDGKNILEQKVKKQVSTYAKIKDFITFILLFLTSILLCAYQNNAFFNFTAALMYIMSTGYITFVLRNMGLSFLLNSWLTILFSIATSITFFFVFDSKWIKLACLFPIVRVIHDLDRLYNNFFNKVIPLFVGCCGLLAVYLLDFNILSAKITIVFALLNILVIILSICNFKRKKELNLCHALAYFLFIPTVMILGYKIVNYIQLLNR